jgi:hypothetical protein
VASLGNPAYNMMINSVMQSLAQRGQGPQQMGGPSGAQPPEMAAQMLSARLNELQGADPKVILQTLQQIKWMAVGMFAPAAMSLPGVSKHLSKLITDCENAVKEAEQALNTQQTVQHTPVGMQAANPQPQGPELGMGVQGPGGGGSPWLGAGMR